MMIFNFVFDYIDGKSRCWRCVYNLARIDKCILTDWAIVTVMMLATSFYGNVP